MQTKRVLFTSTSYPADLDQWQGVFISRMLTGLSRGKNIVLDAWCPPGHLPAGVGSARVADDAEWLGDLSARGGIAHLLRVNPMRGLAFGIQLVRRIRRACQASDADVYHVNWLQCALGLPPDSLPALVTVLGSDMQLLRLPVLHRLLARTFNQRKVVLCPNADWMVPLLQRKFGPRVPVKCVPFGIDDAWYRNLRAPQIGKPHRWICVSRVTKGKLGALFEWAEEPFSSGGRELHLIGPLQDRTIRVPEWINYHGAASPEQLRELWFPQASGLVSLSTHPEGRPQVMLEAMAAGLPVLASANPAHLDLISHRKTGWICNEAAGFESGISFIEDPGNNSEIGQKAREQARSRFGDWDDCASRYIETYEELLR